jgi:hypothetical protein
LNDLTFGVEKMPDQMNTQQIAMLSEELEMLMRERKSLLQIVGAAALLMANLEAKNLPEEAVEAAEILSSLVNTLPEEVLRDALESVQEEAV